MLELFFSVKETIEYKCLIIFFNDWMNQFQFFWTLKYVEKLLYCPNSCPLAWLNKDGKSIFSFQPMSFGVDLTKYGNWITWLQIILLFWYSWTDFTRQNKDSLNISFFSQIIFWCAPFGYLYFLSFLLLNEPGLGARIEPGMALTPLPSSIGRGSNQRPSASDREPSTLLNISLWYRNSQISTV